MKFSAGTKCILSRDYETAKRGTELTQVKGYGPSGHILCKGGKRDAWYDSKDLYPVNAKLPPPPPPPPGQNDLQQQVPDDDEQ